MSGAGDIHHALHDVGTQNQQEVPQPLSSHHRAGQSLPTALVRCLVATNLSTPAGQSLPTALVHCLVTTNLSTLISYRAGQSLLW